MVVFQLRSEFGLFPHIETNIMPEMMETQGFERKNGA